MLLIGTEDKERSLHVDVLYREYHQTLVNFSKDLVERQDVAEDIVSEFFVSLFEKELKFSTEVALRSFLFTSVRNRSFDYLRHLEIENSYVEKYLAEEKQTSASHNEWETSFDEELMNMLFAEIDRLPERCREVLLLSLDGYSNEEIAQRCGISVETVKTQKKRAKKSIKEHLENRKEKNTLYLLLFLKVMYPF
ncbi:MAG: RNA polymerase sigma-70 factor [Bacteroides sp.]|nr:RNA polymerase sigma-70 factor [Bacteroides sp.]